MNKEREYLMIEDLDIDLATASDAELDQFIARLRYSRTRDKSYSGTSPIEMALHLMITVAEKNNRSAAKQAAASEKLSHDTNDLAKRAIYIAGFSAFVAFMGLLI